MAETEIARTCNAFLGGALRIFQPQHGYRAGIDPVLLAASVDAKPGQKLLDLGCGVGVAALCAAQRIPGLSISGLEVQADYAAMARENSRLNKIEFDVCTGDLMHMPAVLKQERFDHVIANPPYFDRAASTAATDPGRERAMGEETPLSLWVSEASKRCAPGGCVTFIYRADRFPDLLSLFTAQLGSIEVLPLIPRQGRAARLVILRGRKGGRAKFRLHDGWLLHAGLSHEGDQENYTAATTSVLRDGAPLCFPD